MTPTPTTMMMMMMLTTTKAPPTTPPPLPLPPPPTPPTAMVQGALTTYGPAAVSGQWNQNAASYRGGLFSSCGGGNGGHAMSLFGYGSNCTRIYGLCSYGLYSYGLCSYDL